MISSAEWPEGSDMEVEALNRATDIAERFAALRRDLASRDTEIACHRSMRKALDRIVQDFVAKWQEQKG